MSEAADALTLRYREALGGLQAQVTVRVEALFDETIDFENLDDSFAVFIPQAASLVAAGQAAADTLSAAYIGALVQFGNG